jgi:hypothetical protein
VLGFSSDAFLEKHWPGPARSRLLMSIRCLKPDAAIAWNYSVWYHNSQGWINPRIEHLYSLKRSLKTYSHLQELGVPAIPHIYWGLPQDLDRWADWLTWNSSVTTIAVDLQTVDGSKAWQCAMRALGYLRALLPRPIHLFASGVCHLERVVQLRSVWPELTLSNMGAYFWSDFVRFKERFGLINPWRDDPEEWSRTTIFNEAVRQYMAVDSSAVASQRTAQFGARHAHSLASSTLNRATLSRIPDPVDRTGHVQLRLWDDVESVA